jgi:hypothetical protein
MKMRTIMLAAIAAFGFAVAANAADNIAAKASTASAFFNGQYPYDNSGFFVGLFTEGTGGSVAATVPGIGPASLTTTTATLGTTIGWAWGRKGSPVAYTLEGDFAVTNFNGNNAGLSLQGPLSFEQRAVIWAPWDKIISVLNITNPFGAVPPFQPLQPGVTANNLQFGIAGALGERDISNAFAGVASNKVWRIEPKIEFLAMEQLSSGIAVRAFTKIGFPDKGAVVGYKGASAILGPDISVGLGAFF